MPTVLFAQPPFSSVPLPSHGRQRLSLGPLGLLSVDPWQMFTSRDHEKRWKKGDFNTTAFRNSTIGCYFPIIGRYFKVDHPFIGDSLGKCLLKYHSCMIWIYWDSLTEIVIHGRLQQLISQGRLLSLTCPNYNGTI